MTTKVGRSNESPSDGRSTNLITARAALGGSTGSLLDAPRKLPGSSNAKPPPPPVRGMSTLSGSTDNLLEASSRETGVDFYSREHASSRNRYQTALNNNQRTTGQTNMTRYGSEENLLSATSQMYRQHVDRHRLPSEDLPPPPSPSTFVSIQPASVVNNTSSRMSQEMDFRSLTEATLQQYRDRDRRVPGQTSGTPSTAASLTSHPGEVVDGQVPPASPLPPPPPPPTDGAAPCAPPPPPLPATASSLSEAIKAAAARTSSTTNSDRDPTPAKQRPSIAAANKQPGLCDLASIVAKKALERQQKIAAVSSDA